MNNSVENARQHRSWARERRTVAGHESFPFGRGEQAVSNLAVSEADPIPITAPRGVARIDAVGWPASMGRDLVRSMLMSSRHQQR